MDVVERKHKILEFRRDLDAKYDSKQKFAYFFDTHKDERIRTDDNRGGTKYTKIKKIDINSYETGIIDTPGAEHIKRERLKGIFFGDVGIFVIEASDLPKRGEVFLNSMNNSKLATIFAPLNIWLKFKDKKRLIIVLSKMDIVGFSEESFRDAVDNLKWFINEKSVEVVPLSIIVDDENDHNFINRSEKFSWYEGPTLHDFIVSSINKPTKITALDKPLFMYIDHQYNDVKGTGKIWRGKVLQGTIQKNTEVLMSSMSYIKKDELIDPLVNVKNLRLGKTEKDIDVASVGDIVTIDINNIRMQGTRIEKKHLNSVRTTCIFDPNTPLLSGNILQFEVKYDDLSKFPLASIIHILWFGRLILCNVISKKLFNNFGLVTIVLLTNLNISLPVDNNGNFYIDRFLLENANDYIEGTLKNLGFLNNLSLHIRNINESKIEMLDYYFKQYPYTLEDNVVTFLGKDLTSLIKNIKNHIDIEDFECGEYEINIDLKPEIRNA